MSIGTFGAFTQARLAIYAAQTGITVTGNNISNVNTPGYTRQRLNQVSLYTAGADRYYAEGDVRVGQGALVKNISQIRNPYLDIRFREENAKVGYYDAYTTGLKSMSFLDETGKGDASKNEDGFGLLGLDIMKLYETLQNVNDQTGHQEYDDSVKGIAQSLVTKIHSYAGKLEEVRNDTIHEFNEDIDMVNSYLKTIRELNEEIRKCEIYGDPALELRDERNRQIDELSALIDIDVTYSEEVITAGLSVEKLTIRLGNANPDGSVLTDEALLVDGVYSAQLAMKTPVVNLLSGYTDVMPAPGSDEYKLMEETAKELLGKETVTAAEIQELVDGGKYLDKNGKPVDDIRDAKMLTGDDNPNYMFTVTALKNKINEILTITTKFDPQKVSGDDMAMGADGNPSTTSIKDLLGRNKSAIVTIEDQPERGDSTLYVYSYKGKDRNNQDVYTVQEVHQILSKPVALDDNDLGGKLQAQRELLTEEGVFIDKNTIANIDENAGTKRGIGYYQKVLDLLANEFAETLNEANQGFLNDEYGNYMGAELDGAGNPILDDAGSPKGKPIEITANGLPLGLPAASRMGLPAPSSSAPI